MSTGALAQDSVGRAEKRADAAVLFECLRISFSLFSCLFFSLFTPQTYTALQMIHCPTLLSVLSEALSPRIVSASAILCDIFV